MNNKKLKKIVIGSTAALLTAGLITVGATDSQARESAGEYVYVPTDCICVATGEDVGDANDCEVGGSQACNDNTCDGLSC